MNAIDGCLQVYSPVASLAACLVGACALALARGLRLASRSNLVTSVLFTLGVCGAHFTAISGTSFVQLPGFESGKSDTITLSIFTAAGAIVIFLGAFLTVLAAKRFEAQERAHSTILSTALHNMSNGLLFIDANRKVGLYNDRYLEMFGLLPQQITRTMPFEALLRLVCAIQGWTDGQRVAIAHGIGEGMSSGEGTRGDWPMPDGRILDIEVRSVPGGGAVLTFDDVTSDRTAQDRIAHLAFHDSLTGLANRHALSLRMADEVEPSQRFSLLLLDLDRFKSVNDSHGHGIGDLLLVEVASRIRTVAGREAFCARMGGDEIALIVPGDLDAATALAEAIVGALAEPFLIEDIRISIGCSIGLCGSHDACDPGEMMKRADIALYEAKRNGRGRVSRYRAGMLEGALERGEFHLAYQPFLSLPDDVIIGFEALIRWEHPTRGLVPPPAFIPLSEETGQIVLIGKWVLETACREAATWAAHRHVAVNVSPVQLRSPLFLSHVTNALAQSGLAPSRLELELTETAMVEDGTEVARVLRDLRTLGVKIAMDDFGTGYSSLAHLRDFPLDRIKIDRSFVMAAATDRHCMAVLTAITQMGKMLEIPTLAEGVETDEELALLRSLGCDAVQGYLIGRPGRLCVGIDDPWRHVAGAA
jgi:diguanylate cyclase (GGDEF)-like protein